jgi:hypothetical protein
MVFWLTTELASSADGRRRLALLDAVAAHVQENIETIKKRVQRARAMVAECLHRKGLFA